VHTGVIPRVADHPLVQWLDRGLRVCINTDNTLLSAVTASEELARVMEIPGMNEHKRAQLLEFGHAGAFPRLTSS
jgi:adenosine deaminase